jgi:C4-dicarboxylate-specific signal transduction histidine kinase
MDMLEAVIEAMPGFVSWVKSDLTYIGVNKRLAAQFNVSPQEFVGKPLGFITPGNPFVLFCEALFNGAADERQAIESLLVPGEGRPRWFQFMGRKYDVGERAVVVGFDVTALREAERTITSQQSVIATSAKMAALGQMAGAIAHEINNPLSVILANGEVLKRNLEKGSIDLPKYIHHAERVVSMSARISKIIRGCRAFARDAAHDPFHKAGVRQIINDTLELCEGKCMQQKVRLNLPTVPDELIIECRPTQISQVLLNLVSNSLDALRNAPNPWISLEVNAGEAGVEIFVVDSGPGIDVSLEEEIFEPFFTTKAVGEGTGLGLSICREIVEEHQGELIIDRLRDTTAFRLYLPYKRQG